MPNISIDLVSIAVIICGAITAFINVYKRIKELQDIIKSQKIEQIKVFDAFFVALDKQEKHFTDTLNSITNKQHDFITQLTKEIETMGKRIDILDYKVDTLKDIITK